MSPLQQIRTGQSSGSSDSRAYPSLSHVHSTHLDDHSYYQDPHHDFDSSDDEDTIDIPADIPADDGETDVEKDLEKQASDPSSNLEVPQKSKPDLEKVPSRSSRTSKRKISRTVTDPNVVTWDGPDDPQNPKNWSKRRKWINTLAVSLFTFMSPVSSSMVAPALTQISRDLGITSDVEASLVLSIFVLAYAVGPLFLGPLSELYGRVHVLQFSNLFYLIFNTACGASKTKGQMIAFRFLAGLGGSAPLAIGGGVLGDSWRPDERGAAIAVYSLAPLLGPSLGPIVGGFVTERTTWRWIFYATSIADAVIQTYGLLVLRETYPPRILHNKTKRLQKETGNMQLRSEYEHPDRKLSKHIGTALSRPFKLLMTQSIIQLMAVYQAYLYGLMYLMLSSFPRVWTVIYGESESIGSLNYISLGIGFSFGTQVCARLQDLIYRRLKKRNNGVGRPEFRVPLIVPGSILVPIGLFIYGWTAQFKTHWIAPNIGAGIFALGSIMCFQGIQTYLVDTYTRYAASAIAAVTVLRSMAGFGFPLFAPSMYAALGQGWGNSLLGFVGIAIGLPAPIFLWYFGEKIRQKSPFAAGGFLD